MDLLKITIFSLVTLLWIEFIDGQSVTCSVKFVKVGCFNDKHKKGKRPLPDYILSDRDPSVKVYSGIKVGWKTWSKWLPDFACRCAKKANSKGYKEFGLQHYGECWSGKSPANYKIDGPAAKDKCVGMNIPKSCLPSDPYCVGKKFTNFVYRIVDKIKPIKPILPIKPVGPAAECEKFVVDIKMPGFKVTKTMNNPISKDFLDIKAELEKTILQVYGDHGSYLSFTLLQVKEDNKAVIAHVYLAFSKKGRHVIGLLEKLGRERLIKAECFKPKPACQGTCPSSCTPMCSSQCCYPYYTYPMYYR